jgi:hypothetical protein
VAQAERFALADVCDVDRSGDLPDFLQLRRLSPLGEETLEFDGDVEMVLDGILATAGHDDDVGYTGLRRFFHPVLDDGLVDQHQHLFGLGLRGGKKPRAQPGGGKHCFSDGRHGSHRTPGALL